MGRTQKFIEEKEEGGQRKERYPLLPTGHRAGGKETYEAALKDARKRIRRGKHTQRDETREMEGEG